MTIKILVIVEGGVVQNIYSTDTNVVEVTLIDYDNVECGDYVTENNYFVEELTEARLQEEISDANEITEDNSKEEE